MRSAGRYPRRHAAAVPGTASPPAGNLLPTPIIPMSDTTPNSAPTHRTGGDRVWRIVAASADALLIAFVATRLLRPMGVSFPVAPVAALATPNVGRADHAAFGTRTVTSVRHGTSGLTAGVTG